jgi:hypothetical protein
MSDLHFSDVSPLCSECGARCDDGYIIKGNAMREPGTGYLDEEIICAACLEEEGRYDAADAAMDMREGA